MNPVGLEKSKPRSMSPVLKLLLQEMTYRDPWPQHASVAKSLYMPRLDGSLRDIETHFAPHDKAMFPISLCAKFPRREFGGSPERVC